MDGRGGPPLRRRIRPIDRADVVVDGAPGADDRARPGAVGSWPRRWSVGMSRRSAGILLYRRVDGEVEVLLGHPGGPYSRPRTRAPGASRRANRSRARPMGGRAPRVRGGDRVPRPDSSPSTSARSSRRAARWSSPGRSRATSTRPKRAATCSYRVAAAVRPRIAIPELDRVAWFTPDEAAGAIRNARRRSSIGCWRRSTPTDLSRAVGTAA